MKFKNKILLGLFMLPFAALAVACGAKHNISSKWKMNAEEHWHECIDEGCEEVFDKATHSMEKVADVAVTCTEDGYVQYKCSVCNYTKKDTTEHTGHEITHHEAKTATCTEAGNTEYYSCSKCNKFYSDEIATQEIAANSWVIAATGHNLEKIEAQEASRTQEGNIAHWYCKNCQKYYSDAEGKTEISQEDAIIPQLVSSVAQARNESVVGDALIVRGIVMGVSQTGASLNISVATTLKDENSNVMMALTGGTSSTSSKLQEAMGKAGDLKHAFPQGTIIEIPVVVSKSSTTYANGNTHVVYLKYSDTEDELSSFVKGQGSTAIDTTDTNIPIVKTQEDFFKFVGLTNGSNDHNTEGFAYNPEVSGANTFKLVKFENLEGVCQSNPDSVEDKLRYYRPMFDESVNSWAKSSISNTATDSATNYIDAHKTYYPVFFNYNTFVNTGKTFSELVFGDAAQNPGYRTWSAHLNSIKDCYCIFAGGSDYYTQFVILDANWVVEKTPAPIPA